MHRNCKSIFVTFRVGEKKSLKSGRPGLGREHNFNFHNYWSRCCCGGWKEKLCSQPGANLGKREEGRPLREGCQQSKWKFKMAFAIRRRPPPPLWHKFPDIFLPHFFSYAIESYIYETDFTLQKYHF